MMTVATILAILAYSMALRSAKRAFVGVAIFAAGLVAGMALATYRTGVPLGIWFEFAATAVFAGGAIYQVKKQLRPQTL